MAINLRSLDNSGYVLLGQRVRQNEYLVINGSAIALSSEPKATAEFERKTTDAYFSEAPLRELVVYERGHSFEREHIQFWLAVKGDICPYQENHAVGDITIDDEILDDVERARALRAAVQDVGNDNRCLKVVAQSGQITASRQWQ